MNEQLFGARVTAKGTSFRLWAPAAQHVELVLEKRLPMRRGEDGCYCIEVASARAGARYNFRIDDELDVPDPASAFQPEDIFGQSEVIDHESFRWRATDWRGRPWAEAVVTEAHVGTFTPEGTFCAMIDKLDHLLETGITALELMPLADFAGSRNWGYDGVYWYAPDSAYGRPEDLKTLIDEAHLRGLMVFLDVVYNHFGPEGNFLGRYAPSFFTDANTPWGSAIDYRVPEVRAFGIQNAVYWLRDYRFDGLRLDAVNSIVEPGEVSILHDISVAVGKLAEESERQIHLIIENSDNRASLLDAAQDPPKGKYRAQWNDDYHHAWHVLLTREEHGYYGDYQRSPLGDLARALGSGYVYQGEISPFWGKKRGEPGGHLPTTCFINFLQNHDQVGNRPFAERLDSLAEGEAIDAALAITLLSPMIPLLFMGEEWGAKEPFPFFCAFKGELADAVRRGRRSEYGWAYRKYGEEVPDPLDPATFRSAVLKWNERESASGRERLALVRELLSIRKREIARRLPRARFGEAAAEHNGLVTANWRMGDGATLRLTANLSAREIAYNSEQATGTLIWGGETGDRLRPWSVFWRIGG